MPILDPFLDSAADVAAENGQQSGGDGEGNVRQMRPHGIGGGDNQPGDSGKDIVHIEFRELNWFGGRGR
jgi:hypothetical protein